MIDLDGAHNEAFNEGFVDEIGVGLAMVQDTTLAEWFVARMQSWKASHRLWA